MNSAAVPPALAHDEVVSPVHCRRCGYNLYGLRADGQCPECGLATWESVLHTVDPAASRLPKLRDPARVGSALLSLTVFLLIGAAVLATRPLAGWVEQLDQTGRWSLSARVPVEFTFLAAAAAVGGMWSLRGLAPPQGVGEQGAVWRDIWLLAGALAIGVVVVTVAGGLERAGPWMRAAEASRLALALPAVIGLLGLRGILGVIGLRSREYRTARGGRQGITAMVAATIGVAASGLIRHLGLSQSWGGLATLGAVIGLISTLMLVIGLTYLVVNAWWIRRALRRPPPELSEILGGGKAAGTSGTAQKGVRKQGFGFRGSGRSAEP